MTSNPIHNEFVTAFARGQLCLHPTDTLVGLTSNSCATLAAYKQRPANKGFVHLAADLAIACRLWQPLPRGWQQRLRQLWPAALTVIWQAADPVQQGTQNGTLAIRVPRLEPAYAWFNTCLRTLQLIPSTSVNQHRHAPLSLAAAIKQLHGDARVHIPTPLLQTTNTVQSASPSTLIELHHDGNWTLVRRGAFDLGTIKLFSQPKCSKK